MKHIFALLIAIAGLSFSHISQAQSIDAYDVVVRPMPRMVEKIDDETFVGYEIDLWKEIASRLGITFNFIEEENFQAVLDKIRNREADFALSTISIRSERAKQMAFSQPYLNSGISVLVRDSGIGLFTYLSTLLSPLLLQTVAAYMVFCVVFGVIFWLLERKHEGEISKHHWPGIFDGLFHAFKKPWGVQSYTSRILVWPLWVFTLLFSSIITAQVIENYDIQKENYLFRGTPDYSRVVIGVVKDTSSDQRLSPRSNDFKGMVRANNADELYTFLKDKKIDAIVAELPLIIDLQHKAGEENFSVSVRPEKLSEEFYGIAINYGVDWKLIRAIDESIMELRDNGFLRELQDQWLSEDKKKTKAKVKIGDK